MTLVYDRTQQLAGQAMMHAFLIGVSDYPNLTAKGEAPAPRSEGLRKLAAPALSAWDLCCWLVRNAGSLAAPLGSVRLLMSPSAIEQANMQAAPVGEPGWIGGTPDMPTMQNLKIEAYAWRLAASSNREDVTIFYFGGHGIEQFGSTLIVLADFAHPIGPLLEPTCRFQNIVDGMAPHSNHPEIARTQFYFVDCCRQALKDFAGLNSTPSAVFDPGDLVDNRATPAFMGSYPGAVALNTPGQRTDFVEALLVAFDSAAEQEDADDPLARWPVRSVTINTALQRHFSDKATGQYAPATGVTFADVTLRWLDEAPLTRFSVLVRPNEQVAGTTIKLKRIEGGFEAEFPGDDDVPHPYPVNARAGIFELKSIAGATEKLKLKMMNQRVRVWPVEV